MRVVLSLLICCFLGIASAASSNIQLDVYSGSNTWWLALAVRNAGVDTRSVQIKQAQASTWQAAAYQSGWGYFTVSTSGSPLNFPLSVQLTSTTGSVVTVNNIVTSPSVGLVDTGVVYGGAATAPTTAPTARPPSAAATTAPVISGTSAPTAAPTVKAATTAPTVKSATAAPTVAATAAPTAKATTASSTGCSAPLKVMVPLYTYPGASWDTVAASGRTVPTVAIINPNSGPGTGPDSTYNTYMAKLNNAGVEMVGYVHTSWGTRDINVVKAEIDIYASQFPLVVGIFLDEGATTDDMLPYYQQLYAYIMGMPGWKYDIINPGTVTTPGYVNAATQIVAFEDVYTNFAGSATPSYASCSNKDKFAVITYGASSGSIQSVVNAAKSKGFYGWFYLTDGAGGCCTYNALTSYYSTMASYIASTN